MTARYASLHWPRAFFKSRRFRILRFQHRRLAEMLELNRPAGTVWRPRP